MNKELADALSIAMASKVIESNPLAFMQSKSVNAGTDNASIVADFIKQLSTRLQQDISDEVDLNITTLMLKG